MCGYESRYHSQVQSQHPTFTYLGLPIKMTSLTREDWQPLIERVEKRLATWKENALSGGRLILVNSVLSSMPLYFMSFYYLSEWVIQSAFFRKGTGTFMAGIVC